MKSKFFYLFGGALILILGIYFFSNYSKTDTTVAVKDQQTSGITKTTDTTADPAQKTTEQSNLSEKPKTNTDSLMEPNAHFSNESDIEGNDIQVEQVDYDGNHFTPALLNIKLGDIVFFKNSSSKAFWPASGPHPTHTAYPEFDAKKSLQPGDTFQFKFTKVGKWSYHNHLNPSVTGEINVSK